MRTTNAGNDRAIQPIEAKPDLEVEFRIGSPDGELFCWPANGEVFRTLAQKLQREPRHVIKARLTLVDPPALLSEAQREITIWRDQITEIGSLLFQEGGFIWVAGIEKLLEEESRGRLRHRHKLIVVIEEAPLIFELSANPSCV